MGMFSRFLGGSQEPDFTQMPLDFRAIYVDGVGYIRQETWLLRCDYRLPPDQWQWEIINPDELTDEERGYCAQIGYAIALIEGAITIKPNTTAHSSFSMN